MKACYLCRCPASTYSRHALSSELPRPHAWTPVPCQATRGPRNCHPWRESLCETVPLPHSIMPLRKHSVRVICKYVTRQGWECKFCCLRCENRHQSCRRRMANRRPCLHQAQRLACYVHSQVSAMRQRHALSPVSFQVVTSLIKQVAVRLFQQTSVIMFS